MHSSSNIFGDNQGSGGENGTSPHNFVVGISIAVATSFIQSLGLTIQRKSHVLNEAIHPKELRRQACQRPLWHLGFHTYILSNLTGTIFSIGYLPVIILAPLGAVTLVFNALFARLLLGDQFSRQSAAGKNRPSTGSPSATSMPSHLCFLSPLPLALFWLLSVHDIVTMQKKIHFLSPLPCLSVHVSVLPHLRPCTATPLGVMRSLSSQQSNRLHPSLNISLDMYVVRTPRAALFQAFASPSRLKSCFCRPVWR